MKGAIKFDKWDYRFMDMAKLVSSWSNCYRVKVGAVAVRDKRTVCMGYNSAPVGVKTCTEHGGCLREKMGIPSGESREKCYSVCAEQAVICSAARQGMSLEGAVVYCTHRPCFMCIKSLINVGVKKVIYVNDYKDELSCKMINEVGFELVQIE
jgi:dCMP deaminase